MELILVRHSIAEEREEFAKKSSEDHLRPLTLKGRKRAQKVAMQMRDWVGDDIDVIVSSPFTRARQTAEIFSQIFMDLKVLEAPELVPNAPPAAFLKWLKAHAKNYRRVLAVGHEPHLSVFASYMLCGKEESLLEVKKGAVVGLELESFNLGLAAKARLQYLLPPKFIVD